MPSNGFIMEMVPHNRERKKPLLSKGLFSLRPRGVEQTQESSGNAQVRETGGTGLGPLDDDWWILPADLSRLIEVWEHLPAATRADIIALARSTAADSQAMASTQLRDYETNDSKLTNSAYWLGQEGDIGVMVLHGDPR
jgi:hypothetical protein